MSDTTDTRPLWRIWRDAENAALGGIEAADLEQVDSICDAARIEALRSWLFPGGRPSAGCSQPADDQTWLRLTAEHRIWHRLAVEIERCQALIHTPTGDSDV